MKSKPAKLAMAPKLPLASASLMVVLALASCSSLSRQAKPTTAPADIEVKDPFFAKLTNAVERFQVEAHGSFSPGTKLIKGVPVTVADGTTFSLRLTLPIDDSRVIHTEEADGTLSLSQPLLLVGIQTPTTIAVEKGSKRIDLNLARRLGVFLFNALQEQSVAAAGGGDMQKLLSSVTIDRAVLELRPAAHIDQANLHLSVGKGSSVEFAKMQFDNRGNYDGHCRLLLKFARGCKYQGKLVDIDFNGGRACFDFNAHRQNGLVKLAISDKQEPVVFDDCSYQFGKYKQCVAHAQAVLKFKRLDWQKQDGASQALLHALAPMTLKHASLKLKNPKLELTALFRQDVASTLQIDPSQGKNQAKGKNEYNWWTEKPYQAETLNMQILCPSSNISIVAANALVGPIALNKISDLGFFLDDGTADLKEIQWQSGKRKFKLVAAKGSKVSISEGGDLDYNRDGSGMHLSLPLAVDVGDATLSWGESDLSLKDVNGSINVVLDKEVDLLSDINFSVARCDLLGESTADVKVKGIDLSSKKGRSRAHFDSCSVVIPEKAVLEAINRQIPKEKTYQIDKVVLKGQKWRYRDAVVTQVIVRNLAIDDLSAGDDHTEHFAASADVEVDGTVEKSGVLAAFKKSSNWQERPWIATGHVKGTGTVSYKFLDNSSLPASELVYDLSLKLPAPSDVELDWSQVSKGLLKKAESAVIVGMLKKIKPVNLAYSGKLKLFARNNAALSHMKVSDLKTVPSNEGVDLRFVADMGL